MKKIMITMALVVLILSNVCGHSLMNALADETELPESQKAAACHSYTQVNTTHLIHNCNKHRLRMICTRIRSCEAGVCSCILRAIGVSSV